MISRKLSDLLYVRICPWQNTGFSISTKRLRAAEQLGSVNIIKAPQKRWMTAVIEQSLAANIATGPSLLTLVSPCLSKREIQKKVGKSRKLKIMLPHNPLQEFEWNTLVCWVSLGLQKHEVLLMEEILHELRLV